METCNKCIDNVDYRNKTARLNSFKNWPVSYIKPEKLAQAGFYFTDRNESIECCECHLIVSKWPNGLNAVANHIFSPKCKFVPQLFSNDVSINLDDKKDNVVHDMEHNEFALHKKQAQYPEYRFYQARLDSFKFWPPAKYQTKEELAEAGLCYTGHRDRVFCFYCGIHLEQWADDEVPWLTHYFWVPTCFYILTIKGEKFYLQNHHNYVIKKEKKQYPYVIHPSLDEQDCQNSKSSKREDAATRNISMQSTMVDKFVKNIDKLHIDIAKTESSKLSNKNSKLICQVCKKDERDILYKPCSHIISCGKCYYVHCPARCSFCKKEIKFIIKIRYE